MTLDSPYTVYGVISLNSVPKSGVIVYAQDITTVGTIINATTNALGQYIIDIQWIASNGHTIKIWSNLNTTPSYTFTLDISGEMERCNLNYTTGLDSPFLVYGTVIQEGDPVADATVYVQDTTTGSTVLTSITDYNGKYIIDIQDIAANGDTITVYSSIDPSSIESFTLDVTGSMHEVNLSYAPIPHTGNTFIITQNPYSRNLILYPAGNETVALTPYGDLANYLCVNELMNSYNEDNDYVYTSSTSDKSDLYGFQPHSIETGVINYVAVVARAKTHLHQLMPTGTFKLQLKSGSTTGQSSNLAPIMNSYANYMNIWTTNPDTAGAWTWTQIDSLQAGILCKSITATYNLSLVLRPNADYTKSSSSQIYGYPSDGVFYTKVDEENPDDDLTYLYTTNDAYYDAFCWFGLESTTETGTIANLTHYMMLKNNSLGYNAFYQHGYLLVGTGTVDGGAGNLGPGGYHLKSWVSTTKPGGGAWTFTDLANTKQKIYLVNDSGGQLRLTQAYTVVNYSKSLAPELRVTQCYVIVNYTPAPQTLIFNLPESMDYKHGRSLESTKFNDGTITHADVGCRGKTLIIRGHENSNASKIQDLKTMKSNRSPVTISGLSDDLDTEYMISKITAVDQGGTTNPDYEYELELDKYEGVG